MPFHVTGPYYCLVCPPVMVGKSKDRKSSETELVLGIANYSGCGVDIAGCPECGRNFQISYQMKEIVDLGPSKRGPTRAEREQEEQAKKDAEDEANVAYLLRLNQLYKVFQGPPGPPQLGPGSASKLAFIVKEATKPKRKPYVFRKA